VPQSSSGFLLLLVPTALFAGVQVLMLLAPHNKEQGKTADRTHLCEVHLVHHAGAYVSQDTTQAQAAQVRLDKLQEARHQVQLQKKGWGGGGRAHTT
jgi:hypothetical protein